MLARAEGQNQTVRFFDLYVSEPAVVSLTG